jgi:hypothetical protein
MLRRMPTREEIRKRALAVQSTWDGQAEAKRRGVPADAFFDPQRDWLPSVENWDEITGFVDSPVLTP